MKTTLFAMVAIGALAMPLGAQESNLTGSWKMSLQGDHVIPMGLTLTQEGAKLTGTLMIMGKDVPLTGEITKGELTLSGKAKLMSRGSEASGEAADLKLTGRILDDGTLAGDMPSPHGGKLTWVAERFRERKAAKSSIDGTWNVAVETDHVFKVAMVIKQDGTKVTGTFMMPGADVPIEGTFDGAKFDAAGETPKDATGHAADLGTIKLAGTLNPEGAMAGSVSFGGRSAGTLKWTAERLRKPKQ